MSDFGSAGHNLPDNDEEELRIAKSGGKITGVGASSLRDAAEFVSAVPVPAALLKVAPAVIGTLGALVFGWMITSQRPDAQLLQAAVKQQEMMAKQQQAQNEKHAEQIEEMGKMLKQATRPSGMQIGLIVSSEGNSSTPAFAPPAQPLPQNYSQVQQVSAVQPDAAEQEYIRLSTSFVETPEQYFQEAYAWYNNVQAGDPAPTAQAFRRIFSESPAARIQ